MTSGYLELIKLRQTALLVWTAFAGYIAAAGRDLDIIVLVLISVSIFLAVSGTTAASMYIDSDIDKIMSRTKDRPIPSARILPWHALLFGLILVGTGLTLAALINWLVVLLIFIGFLGDVVVYGFLLKRRTSLSIIFGGVAGGMPALAGWTAFTSQIELNGILLALMVMAWIPVHILTLALVHVQDYEKAQIPMLPVVSGQKKTRQVIILSNFILAILAFALYPFGGFGRTYLVLVSIPTLIFLIGSIHVLFRNEKELYWRLFKVSGPYILIIYISLIVDVLVPIF